ncbi:hypothetical protein SVAN01_08325 [Stagonosporopsis vannaccii]|nr:hypothetical protein SVAN01_08325 [Stagonosporopsis vannaccii]
MGRVVFCGQARRAASAELASGPAETGQAAQGQETRGRRRTAGGRIASSSARWASRTKGGGLKARPSDDLQAVDATGGDSHQYICSPKGPPELLLASRAKLHRVEDHRGRHPLFARGAGAPQCGLAGFVRLLQPGTVEPRLPSRAPSLQRATLIGPHRHGNLTSCPAHLHTL